MIGGLAAGLPIGVATSAAAGPALLRADRPVRTHGVQSGDVLDRSGLGVGPRGPAVASAHRGLGPARPDLNDTCRIAGPVLTADTDYTGKARVRCDRGRTVYYRVTVEDLDGRSANEPVIGSFRVRPARGEGVRFVWSGDIAGQGWGINSDDGGMRIFTTMRVGDPDFFICNGDTVYADGPLRETVTLADGRIWRNVVTPEKSKVAETLTEFRGQYAYNLLDEHLRAFAAAVPQVNQWDGHEVTNNWYPGEVLTDDRYTERRVDVLAARVFQAFHEWVPLDPRRAVDGRIYRRLPYGPHVEVFVSTYGPTGTPTPTRTSVSRRSLGS